MRPRRRYTGTDVSTELSEEEQAGGNLNDERKDWKGMVDGRREARDHKRPARAAARGGRQWNKADQLRHAGNDSPKAKIKMLGRETDQMEQAADGSWQVADGRTKEGRGGMEDGEAGRRPAGVITERQAKINDKR
jgi:hypothetical protein